MQENFADYLWMTCKQQKKYTMSKVELFGLPKFNADLEGGCMRTSAP